MCRSSKRSARASRSGAFEALTFPELLAGDGDPNSILLTFDDGWSSVWSAAAPIANRYGVKFTLFLAPDCVEESLEIRTTLDTGASPAEVAPRDLGHRARLTWGEVLALQMTGHCGHSVALVSPRCRVQVVEADGLRHADGTVSAQRAFAADSARSERCGLGAVQARAGHAALRMGARADRRATVHRIAGAAGQVHVTCARAWVLQARELAAPARTPWSTTCR